jgi:hypothetical protein
MPDLVQMIEQVQEAVGVVPQALLAIALLVGPTLMWLLYRAALEPRMRPAYQPPDPDSWLCESCLSVNKAAWDRCYRCEVARFPEVESEGELEPEEDEELADHDVDEGDVFAAPVPVVHTSMEDEPVGIPVMAPRADDWVAIRIEPARADAPDVLSLGASAEEEPGTVAPDDAPAPRRRRRSTTASTARPGSSRRRTG